MLDGLGIAHDVDMPKLLDAGDIIMQALRGRPTMSRAAAALQAKRKQQQQQA